MRTNISNEFQKVHDFESLIVFLRDTLHWPIPDGELEFEDITFDWSAEYLKLSTDAQARIIGCRQLRIFDLIFDLPARHLNHNTDSQPSQQLQLFDTNSLESQQPWGIFFVEFNNNVKIDACKTLLRQVLQGLVGGYNQSSSLPFWRYDKLLFICVTSDFQNIGFVRFMGKKGRPIVDDYIPLNFFKLSA